MKPPFWTLNQRKPSRSNSGVCGSLALGSGSAYSRAQAVNTGNQPSASATGSSVSASWTATTLQTYNAKTEQLESYHKETTEYPHRRLTEDAHSANQ